MGRPVLAARSPDGGARGHYDGPGREPGATELPSIILAFSATISGTAPYLW
jgi:hypothetical protein